MCDLRALECAHLFKRLLQPHTRNVKIVRAHVPRSVVDLNRAQPQGAQPPQPQGAVPPQPPFTPTRGAHPEWTRFDKSIQVFLNQHQKKNIVLLDVHSFPKGSFNSAQIAIIDIMNKERPELQLLIAKVQRELKIDIQLFKGGTNYIQNTYQTKCYPVLLEFCEDTDYLKQAEIKQFMLLFIDFFGLLSY